MTISECSLNFGWSEAQRVSIESGRLTGVWIPYVPPRQNSCFKSQMLNISQAYLFFVSSFILPSEEERFSAKADGRSCVNIQASIPSFTLEYPYWILRKCCLTICTKNQNFCTSLLKVFSTSFLFACFSGKHSRLKDSPNNSIIVYTPFQ